MHLHKALAPMGGTHSSALSERQPDWEVYVRGEWRSEQSRELDEMGGLDRAPVARGGSFSAKLQLLEATLKKHGNELQEFFNPVQPQEHHPKALGRLARKGKVVVPEMLAMERGGRTVVAEWRIRVHAARRRVLIIVKCVVRLMRGTLRVAPVPRLDHFDFAIYQTLGAEWIKVAEEQQRYALLKEAVDATTVALQDAIQAMAGERPAAMPGNSLLSRITTMRSGDANEAYSDAAGSPPGRHSLPGQPLRNSTSGDDGLLIGMDEAQRAPSNGSPSRQGNMRPNCMASGMATGQPSVSARRSQHGPSLLGLVQQQHGANSDKGNAPVLKAPLNSGLASPERCPKLIVRTGNRRPSSPPRDGLEASAMQAAGGSVADAHASVDASAPATINAPSDARTASTCSSSGSSSPSGADAVASAGADVAANMEPSTTDGGDSAHPDSAGCGLTSSLLSGSSLTLAKKPSGLFVKARSRAVFDISMLDGIVMPPRSSSPGGALSLMQLPAQLQDVLQSRLSGSGVGMARGSDPGIATAMASPLSLPQLPDSPKASMPWPTGPVGLQPEDPRPAGHLPRIHTKATPGKTAAPAFSRDVSAAPDTPNSASRSSACGRQTSLILRGASEDGRMGRSGVESGSTQQQTADRRNDMRVPLSSGRDVHDHGSDVVPALRSSSSGVLHRHADSGGASHQSGLRRSNTNMAMEGRGTDATSGHVGRQPPPLAPSSNLRASAPTLLPSLDKHANRHTLTGAVAATLAAVRMRGLALDAPSPRSNAQASSLPSSPSGGYKHAKGSSHRAPHAPAAPAPGTGAASPTLSPAQQQQDVAALREKLQAHLDELQHCAQLTAVFLNRCNAAWSEAQSWAPPAIVNPTQIQNFARGTNMLVHKEELLTLLRVGGMAFYYMAAEDFLAQAPGTTGPRNAGGAAAASSGGGADADASPSKREQVATGHSNGRHCPRISAAGDGVHAVPRAAATAAGCPDVWTSDPWKLLEQHRPGLPHFHNKLEALSVGTRCIAALALALEAAAGKQALAKVPLVLAVNEDQQDDVVRELWTYKFFGIPRHNVLVVVQPRHPGYTYDAKQQTWDKGAVDNSLQLGSGYGLMQLAWGGEAMRVSEDGCLEPLSLPALEWLEQRGVSWILSRRARDLSLLTKEGALDMTTMAYGLFRHAESTARHRPNVMLEVMPASNLVTSRNMDSLVLSRRCDSDGAPCVDASAVLQSVELCHADLATPTMHAVMSDCVAAGKVAVGLGRYMLHLPSAKGMLAGRLSVLRPKLSMCKDLLHLRLDMCDITAAPSAAPLFLHSRAEPAQVLLTHDDVEALLPLLSAQDSHAGFRQLVLSHQVQTTATPPPPPPDLADNPNSQRIVVFVVSNAVSGAAISMAASVARPGRDTVTIVTIVADTVFKDRAAELLQKYTAAFAQANPGVQCFSEIKERGLCGLIECMELYLVGHGATLAVMGSNALTSKASSSTGDVSSTYVVGSITLALLKRMPVPLLLVTRPPAVPNKEANQERGGALSGSMGGANLQDGGRRPLRIMCVLDGQARGMVDYMAGKLFNQAAGDSMFLSYVKATSNMTRQQEGSCKALLSRFISQVTGMGVRLSQTLVLDNPMDKALAAAVSENFIDIMAVVATPCKCQLQPAMISTMRSVHSAVLWYRDQ